MSCRAAHSKSQWRSCLLILFYVVMFSFRWKKLPVISVFDILHAVSFNHSGLRRLLAWPGAEQTSAQHWTFCTDWIMAFLKSFKLGNSLDICLVTSGECLLSLHRVIALPLSITPFVWIDCCHVTKCNATFQLRPNLNSSFFITTECFGQPITN